MLVVKTHVQLFLCLLLPIILRNAGNQLLRSEQLSSLFFIQKVKPSTVEMKEGGVRLRLTVVDTPGFGDAVDNTDW